MTAETQPPSSGAARAATPDPKRKRRGLLLLLLALLVVAAVVGLVLLLTGGDDEGSEGGVVRAENAFVLRFPEKTWRELPRAELDKIENKPVAGVRRRDSRSVVLVEAEPPRRITFRDLERDLDRELAGRFRDFRKGEARMIDIRAGRAFYYSFARTRAGTAGSITLVKIGGQNYSLNSVIQGGSREAAIETGAIIRSFDGAPE